MLTPDLEHKNSPPRIIPSLVEGFNAVAGRIYLIIFPVVIDIFLWFGPLVRVKNLILPALLRTTELSAGAYGDGASAMIENSKQLWTLLLEGFNLLFAIRTYPIGIPSLMISQGSNINPIGQPLIFEIGSVNTAGLALLILVLLGVFLGSFYYALIARSTDKRISDLDISMLFGLVGQSTLLSIFLILLLVILGLPAMCFISSILLFLPSLGTLPFLIFGFFIVWVMLPLAFSPHGIFLSEMKAVRSIVTSVKLVRTLMAGTGIFFILVIFLSYGLDILWATPGTNSWLMVIGIIGHGFISSGLLAASFVFYRDGVEWLSEFIRSKETNPQHAGFLD
ncbi:MAG TPA: hypothetical protein VMW28_09350 [Pelolinea sp.]|nr:hypothetical protein [Pelolinea sp.]